MLIPRLDIFKKDPDGNPFWLEAAVDLARLRMAELAAAVPGEYFVFDQTTGTVVARN